MNILLLLEKDHRKMVSLFESFEGRGKIPEAEFKKRFDEIKENALRHMKVEETLFYPVLEKHQETKAIIQHSYEEHNEVKSMIKELDKIAYDYEAVSQKMKQLKENLQHHIQEEEKTLFPKVNSIIPGQQLSEMAKKMEAMVDELV